MDLLHLTVLRAAIAGHQYVEDLLSCNEGWRLEPVIADLQRSGAIRVIPQGGGRLLAPGPASAPLDAPTEACRRPPA
ncbi:MAG TPA: hypothetical protein VFH47_07890 [Candidatus Thermoplasmatota archaeon]|nr:hypothetical protein [Candidatus Thermoplasmatota archaeon]